MIKNLIKKWKPDLSNISTTYTRESVRPHRSYIDNEYFRDGYASFFPHSTTVIFLILSKYANFETQICYPSIESVMREAGMKNRNYVSRALKILKAYNIIQVVSGSKGRVPNVYLMISHEYWKEINSDNFDTVLKRLKKPKKVKNIDATVSTKKSQQYQNQPNNSIFVDTESHIKKSEKIFEVRSNLQIKGKQLIETLSPAVASVVMPYFAESDVTQALEKIYTNTSTEKCSSRDLLKVLFGQNAQPIKDLPNWLKI